MFALSNNSAFAVTNTSFVPALKFTNALLLLDALTVSLVKPVVPLNVPLPTSHSEVPTMQYGTTKDAEPKAVANA